MAEDPPMVIKITPFKRVMLVTLGTLEHLLYFVFAAQVVHCFAYPLPSLFSAPTLLTKETENPSYIWNAVLFSLFFVQHMIMATIGFKKFMAKLSPEYPFY